MLKRNAAGQSVLLYAFRLDRTSDVSVTGHAASISCAISLDNAASTSSSNSPTEAQNGFYWLSLSQAETNGATVDIFAVSSNSSIAVIPVYFSRYTTTSDTDAIAAEIASQLASVPIKLLSPYSTNSKRLELVQDADYQNTGASQSIDFEITQPGIIAGDAVYFGAELATNNSTIGPITGTVIDDAGTLKARIEIVDSELAGKTPSENWLFTVVHRKDGITTPLIASSPMTLKENQVGMIL